MKRREGGEKHNKELHDLYPSPIIIRKINSRSRRLASHVALMGREERV
jgi:hypothetical protein